MSINTQFEYIVTMALKEIAIKGETDYTSIGPCDHERFTNTVFAFGSCDMIDTIDTQMEREGVESAHRSATLFFNTHPNFTVAIINYHGEEIAFEINKGGKRFLHGSRVKLKRGSKLDSQEIRTAKEDLIVFLKTCMKHMYIRDHNEDYTEITEKMMTFEEDRHHLCLLTKLYCFNLDMIEEVEIEKLKKSFKKKREDACKLRY